MELATMIHWAIGNEGDAYACGAQTGDAVVVQHAFDPEQLKIDCMPCAARLGMELERGK
jgi:hypothetical protein